MANRLRIFSSIGVCIPAVFFEGFNLGGDLSDGPPEHRGQYTALLGMIADEANDASHAVDFLHPRRPPVQRRQSILST